MTTQHLAHWTPYRLTYHVRGRAGSLHMEQSAARRRAAEVAALPVLAQAGRSRPATSRSPGSRRRRHDRPVLHPATSSRRRAWSVCSTPSSASSASVRRGSRGVAAPPVAAHAGRGTRGTGVRPRPVGRNTTGSRFDDTRALDRIAALLDGREWEAETLDDVAPLVRDSGRLVRDVDDIARRTGSASRIPTASTSTVRKRSTMTSTTRSPRSRTWSCRARRRRHRRVVDARRGRRVGARRKLRPATADRTAE